MLYGTLSYALGKVTVTQNSANVKGITTAKTEIIEKPVPSTDFQSPEIIASSIKLCSNTQLGYQISYPADWFTTFNTEDQKCTFFAPYSFVIPHFVEETFTPVNVEVIEPDNWLSTLQFYENPNDFYNVVASSNLELNGKLVKKIEAKSTGENSLPRGNAYINYLVFDGQKPIRLSYTQLDQNEDLKYSQEVAETMVENLSYF